jgi:hypothetical protein
MEKNDMMLYSGHKSDKCELGTGCYISRHNMDNMLDFEMQICKIRIKLKYYNLTLISTHAPTEEKYAVVREKFYSSLEKACNAVSIYDMNTVLWDFSAKVGREPYIYPACDALT